MVELFVIVTPMNDNGSSRKTQERLENVAQEISGSVAKPPKLQAILLQGSVAKGLADAYSDIELMCIWSAEPTPEERTELFASLGLRALSDEDLENGEWCSSFSYKQIKVDICHDDISLLQHTIDDVMNARVTSIASQTLLASIQDAKPLHGQVFFDGLVASFADYPEALAIKCIKVNASFQEWSMRNALYERGDTVALHHLVDLTSLQMLRLLYAVNRVYLRNYNFKWIDQLDQLKLKPADLKDRLRSILSGHVTESSLRELTALLEETLRIASERYPDLDLVQAVKTLSYVREKASG